MAPYNNGFDGVLSNCPFHTQEVLSMEEKLMPRDSQALVELQIDAMKADLVGEWSDKRMNDPFEVIDDPTIDDLEGY